MSRRWEEHTGARKAGSVKAWGRRYNFALEFKVFKGLVRWPDKSQNRWPRGLRGWLGPGSLSPKVPLSPELQPSSPGTASRFSEPDSAVRKRVWAVCAALLIRRAGPVQYGGRGGHKPSRFTEAGRFFLGVRTGEDCRRKEGQGG